MRCFGGLTAVPFVCHQSGHWNAVSGDQFGEHTGIKTGKTSLKVVTLQPELVAEWVDTLPFTVMLTDLMNSMYDKEDGNAATSTSTKYKE